MKFVPQLDYMLKTTTREVDREAVYATGTIAALVSLALGLVAINCNFADVFVPEACAVRQIVNVAK